MDYSKDTHFFPLFKEFYSSVCKFFNIEYTIEFFYDTKIIYILIQNL